MGFNWFHAFLTKISLPQKKMYVNSVQTSNLNLSVSTKTEESENLHFAKADAC